MGGQAGRLIVLEGPDGVGKSTQADRLGAWLAARGCDVVRVREPGGTPVGEAVRGLLLDSELGMEPLTEMILFAAARAELMVRVVMPALGRGAIVVMDRFVLSSLAYQGAGGGVPPEDIRRVNQVATAGVTPDVTIVLDGMGFAASKAPDRLERRSAAYRARVRAGYRALAREDPAIQVVSADATVDAVHAEIVSIIQPWLASGEAPR